MGTVESIIIRPEKKGEPKQISTAYIHTSGMEGDHYTKPDGRRQVTLISARALAEVSASVGFQGDSHIASRRNICVDSLPDEDLIGKRIGLGNEVILEITCYCDPCKRMDENFGEGAVQAFEKKAGWGAIVIHSGSFSIGDDFRML